MKAWSDGYTSTRGDNIENPNEELKHLYENKIDVTLLENSYGIAYDTEGRIILPAELIDHAGLNDEALFVGRGTRFQIWQPKAYKDYNDRAFERVKNQGVTLRLKTLPDGASS